MFTINFKGTPNPKDRRTVKITAIFHRTGYCRAKKLLNITGLFKDWDENTQCFKVQNAEYEKHNTIAHKINKLHQIIFGVN